MRNVKEAPLQLSVDELVSYDVWENEDGILGLFIFWVGEVCRDCGSQQSVECTINQDRRCTHCFQCP